MDIDLPGSEMPGAILEYIKELKEKEKNKEIDLKEIKKKIFETFMNVKREIKEEDDDYYGNKLVQLLKYDDSITQEMYETIRLSDPSKIKPFYAKLSTKKEIEYIGPIVDVKIKKNYEPNQFVVILANGLEVTYDKKYIRKREDKKIKIEKILENFEKLKNDKILHIYLKMREYHLGQNLIKEPFIEDYYEWNIWEKYKNIILNKKEKYRITFYEYLISGLLGLNIFDLEGKEKNTFDSLYIPRILSLFIVKTQILPNDLVPYTHILQLTPPATGKTQFALTIKSFFNCDYFDKNPSRAKLVYNAQTNTPGAIFKRNYIIIDEFTKWNVDDIKNFIAIVSTGLSSGEWVIEKGSDIPMNTYKPVGFIVFGNVLGDKEIENIQKINPYFEGIDYKKFETSREAAKNILYKGLKKPDYLSDVNTFIDRFAIASTILETINLAQLGVLNLAPNPLELYALPKVIQERINIIAKDPEKYLDIDKIKRENWEDGRLYSNAIKIAIKIKALEIDKYLDRPAEDLAIEMVKGLWGWNPK